MNPPPALFSDKRALRARLRAARDAFVMERPRTILPPPGFVAALSSGMIVASYLPLGSEADPAALVVAAREAGCTLALPRVVSREAPIDFRRWDVDTPMERGPFDLRQPSIEAGVVSPDIILVPLVGFDARCNRLGQGAGHYDRALESLPDARTLGVAWSVQQVDALPVDPWDRPLDAIVTEASLFERDAV